MEAPMVLKFKAIIPQSADFGSDDQIWNSGVEGWGPKSSRLNSSPASMYEMPTLELASRLLLAF